MTVRSLPAAAAAVLCLLLVAPLPVAAKEGFVARLDAPFPIDAAPGTTIEVGWTVTQGEGAQALPMVGSPVFIRLVPRGTAGDPVSAFGTERPSGSGHYVAELAVPAGGIAAVEIGLRGESCSNGSCQTSDMLFAITPRTADGRAALAGPAAYPAGPAPASAPRAVHPVARAAAPGDAAAPAVVGPANGTSDRAIAMWLVAIAGLGGIAAAAAVSIRRRRAVRA